MESRRDPARNGHLRVVIEPREREEPVATDSARKHSEALPLPQPAYGVRADRPGPRGCWTRKANGDLCGAARRADGDFCNAHSGLGVAKNPAEWSAVGGAVASENRRRRAALRFELGITRPHSIRGMLKAGVYAERERVVRAALAGLDAENPTQRSKTALALLDAVDPPRSAELSVSLPSDPEGIKGMGLGELRALAESIGLDPSLPGIEQGS